MHSRGRFQVELVADIERSGNISSPAADAKKPNPKVACAEPAEQTVDLEQREDRLFHILGNVEGCFCSTKDDRRHRFKGSRNPEDGIVGLLGSF